MKITIMRHGRPAFDWEISVKGSDFKSLESAYDTAGISDTPAEDILSNIGNHNFIVCSNLPRSLESAKAIGVSTVHLSSDLFREMNLPYFDRVPVKLPLKLWVTILRSLWFMGFSKNTESITTAKARAKIAAIKLADLAVTHNSVLLVGHGFLNHYVAKHLLANNWKGPSSPGNKYWEYGTYQYKHA